MEGVADNSVVVGFGNTLEEATQDHDQNLDDLFQCCKVRNLKLNDKKRKIKMQEVPFIGHVATAEGLCVHPSKVQAIVEMPPPSEYCSSGAFVGPRSIPQQLPAPSVRHNKAFNTKGCCTYGYGVLSHQ